MRRLRGRVERARREITAVDSAEPEFISGGWFYEVRDLDRPAGGQILIAGVRNTQPAAFSAACSEIKLRSGGGR